MTITLDPAWVKAEILREERPTEERIKYIRDLAMECLAQQEEHAAARIAELEAALFPFAGDVAPGLHDDRYITGEFYVRDFRRAAAVLRARPAP